MQYEEKLGADDRSALEERIIAHFDGSLDHASSKALLDEVMASPEKRALFRAHETLSSVIAAARVPMEAPLETRREIADRIPGLIAFLPGLLGTAEVMPILQQSTNPFISFFARMSVQTAVSIGSAIAVLTTAGIIVKNNLDNNAPLPTKITMVQKQPTTSTPAQSYAMAPSSSISTNANASVGIARHTSSHVSAITATVGTNIGVDHPVASHATMQEAATTQHDIAIAQQKTTQDENSYLPPVSNAFDAPKSTTAVAANIPVMQPQILTPMPAVVGEGISVRLYASSGTRMLQLPGINNSPSSSQFVPNSILGLEFELGDRYAFRVQGGQSSFAQVAYTKPVSKFAGMTVYGPTAVAQTGNWATVGMSYSIAVTEWLPIIVSADAGAAFPRGNSTGFMGMFGAATEIQLSSTFMLRPQLTYDAVSTAIQAPQNNGIYQSAVSQTSMWSSSFGLQVNLMYRF